MDIQNQFLDKPGCCPKEEAPIGAYLFHVPKCGGTSIRRTLGKYLDAGGLTCCNHAQNAKIVGGSAYYNCVKSIPDKKRYLKEIFKGRFLQECTVIASHNDVTLLNKLDTHNKFGQKQLLDIIVLRDPVNRLLSELKMFTVKIGKEDISVFQDPLRQPGFFKWMNFHNNLVTKLLSGFIGCYDFSHPVRQGRPVESHLKTALVNLSQFCVIILLEEPQCGLAQLSSIFNKNLAYLPHPNPNPGVNPEFRFAKKYVEKANQSTKHDQIVYEFAQKLNRQQCEQLGIDPDTYQQ